ncbi:hypothetical protein HYW74_03040 [Candidatus Pacearchaeota archaeon]|nr:hypothetical protein [Candidatus Pacearchaeota archaeon]
MEENENSESEEKKVDEVIEIRKDKIAKLLKGKEWIYYIILAAIVYISVYIRTRNIPRLKDISTGTWTLGPDLDPFLFLRWAEYIVEHGKLFMIDKMRYVPLGHDTGLEKKFLSYLIAWFHKGFSIFSNEPSITYSAIIFPVFMFALTCIAFFFLVRKIFYDNFENKNIPNMIALISTLFLAIIPSILPRTIAGIPEKESAGFLFIFLSFYFFICSFKSKNYKSLVIYSLLAGLATVALSYTWGGATFVYLIMGLSVFVAFALGNIRKRELLAYSIWIFIFLVSTIIFSPQFSAQTHIINFLTSTFTIPVFASLFFILFHLFAYPKIKNIKACKILNEKYHISGEIISIIFVFVILILASLPILGVKFIPSKLDNLMDSFIRPLAIDRFSMTVAENKQPSYIEEWKGSFGPNGFSLFGQNINTPPLFFSLFFIGSIILFYNINKKFEKKDKILLTATYTFAMIGLIFSKYAPNSQLNGLSSTSLMIYFGGMAIFIGSSIYILYKYNKENKKDPLKIDFGYIIVFTLFFVSILAARSGVRFVMVVVPPASILAGYFIVSMFFIASQYKDKVIKNVLWILVIIIILLSMYTANAFYKESMAQANGFYPGIYQWQWQKAMAWVRDNTQENAVFAHWWDYGYWLQSIGRRATVLDGGNLYTYWDHLMGRYVLTTPDDATALNFLYTHNATHLLIDSTDIGKYSAFSSIGADENYDRFSYMPTFSLDPRSTKETSQGTLYAYVGGSGLDEDIIWKDNNTEIRFLAESSGIGAIIIEEISNNNSKEFLQPKAIIVQNNGQQTQVPMRYLYYNNKLHDFKSGIEAGFFLVEVINPPQKLDYGAGIYLSKRTVNSLLVRKYLFGEEGNFKLVHNEPSFITADLRRQGFPVNDFAYYQGQFLAPIKIWEINYPPNVKINQSYLETNFPNDAVRKPR